MITNRVYCTNELLRGIRILLENICIVTVDKPLIIKNIGKWMPSVKIFDLTI